MVRVALVGLLLMVLLSDCTRDQAINPCPYHSCPDTVSFRAAIIPIFAQYCASTGCHPAANPKANVALDSAHAYASVTLGGTGYVEPGNADNSILYDQLQPGAMQMPPTGAPQPTSCEVQAIYCWIQQGALNN